MTLVQQCKAWFEAGQDEQIIDTISNWAKEHHYELDSSQAQKDNNRELIDVLFWLGAAHCRLGIKQHYKERLKAGLQVLLPLYSEYCDDLNYYVSLALAFEYLGQYEQALYYLYEAAGQFPKVAHLDDMIIELSGKMSLRECQGSFNLKARKAWQELLEHVPAITNLLALPTRNDSEQQSLQDLIAKPFYEVSSFFDVQLKQDNHDTYFYLTCHGDECLFLALHQLYLLKRDGFPSSWHFELGLRGDHDVCLNIDNILFDSAQTWCALESLEPAYVPYNCSLATLAQNLSSLKPFALSKSPEQILANNPKTEDEVLAQTNLTNNLGLKRTQNYSNNDTSINDCDLSGLDPELFADLFDAMQESEEPNTDSQSNAIRYERYGLKVFHPLLYTWFKTSKNQHPLVLERMMRTLLSYSIGELNTIAYFKRLSLAQEKPALSFKLNKLHLSLEAMDLKDLSYDEYVERSYRLTNIKSDQDIAQALEQSVHYYDPELSSMQLLSLMCAGCIPCSFAFERKDIADMEIFDEQLVRYVKEQGFNFSMQLLGYSRDSKYHYLELLAFDLELCLHALSAFISENYSDLTCFKGSLLLKDTPSVDITLCPEYEP